MGEITVNIELENQTRLGRIRDSIISSVQFLGKQHEFNVTA